MSSLWIIGLFSIGWICALYYVSVEPDGGFIDFRWMVSDLGKILGKLRALRAQKRLSTSESLEILEGRVDYLEDELARIQEALK